MATSSGVPKAIGQNALTHSKMSGSGASYASRMDRSDRDGPKHNKQDDLIQDLYKVDKQKISRLIRPSLNTAGRDQLSSS